MTLCLKISGFFISMSPECCFRESGFLDSKGILEKYTQVGKLNLNSQERVGQSTT